MAQLSTAGSHEAQANTTAGFVAVLLAACTSGFSGVYFESILKSSRSSLWVRNIQMGFTSIALGFVGIYFSGELEGVVQNGFFYGYNNLVVTVILLQAIGGLVVAVVVKYADNILKGFAASFSILTSCLLTYFFFDFHPNALFLFGALLVNVSMYLYSFAPKKKDKEGDSADKDSADGSGDKSRSSANAIPSVVSISSSGTSQMSSKRKMVNAVEDDIEQNTRSVH